MLRLEESKQYSLRQTMQHRQLLLMMFHTGEQTEMNGYQKPLKEKKSIIKLVLCFQRQESNVVCITLVILKSVSSF